MTTFRDGMKLFKIVKSAITGRLGSEMAVKISVEQYKVMHIRK